MGTARMVLWLPTVIVIGAMIAGCVAPVVGQPQWQSSSSGVYFTWDIITCSVAIGESDPFGGPSLQRVALTCGFPGSPSFYLHTTGPSPTLADVAFVVDPGPTAPWLPAGSGGIVTPGGQVWSMNLAHPDIGWLFGGSMPMFTSSTSLTSALGFMAPNYLPPETRLYGQAVVLDPTLPDGFVIAAPAGFIATRRNASVSITIPAIASIQATDLIAMLGTTTWHIYDDGQDVLPVSGWWLNGNGLATEGGPMTSLTPSAAAFGGMRAIGVWADHGPSVTYTVTVMNQNGAIGSQISGPGWSLTAQLWPSATVVCLHFDTTSLSGPIVAGVSDQSGMLSAGLPAPQTTQMVGPTGWYTTTPGVSYHGWTQYSLYNAFNPFSNIVNWYTKPDCN